MAARLYPIMASIMLQFITSKLVMIKKQLEIYGKIIRVIQLEPSDSTLISRRKMVLLAPKRRKKRRMMKRRTKRKKRKRRMKLEIKRMKKRRMKIKRFWLLRSV